MVSVNYPFIIEVEMIPSRPLIPFYGGGDLAKEPIRRSIMLDYTFVKFFPLQVKK